MSAIGDPSFSEIKIKNRPELTNLVGMVEYSDHHSTFMSTCYPKPKIKNTLGEWVSLAKKKQFRPLKLKSTLMSHFLNGGNEKPLTREDRNMPHSPKVATYDLKPEMSSEAVTDALVEAIEINTIYSYKLCQPRYGGAYWRFRSAIKACEAVDIGIGRLVDALKKVDGILFLTADHGNWKL